MSYSYIESNKDKIFNLERKITNFYIDKDYNRDIVITGWLNQMELNSAFISIEKDTSHFWMLRKVDIMNNFFKLFLKLGIILFIIFFFNSHPDYSKNTFSIFGFILSCLFLYKKYYEYMNIELFINDVELTMRKINRDFFNKKFLECIFDYENKRLILALFEDGKIKDNIMNDKEIRKILSFNQYYVDSRKKKKLSKKLD